MFASWTSSPSAISKRLTSLGILLVTLCLSAQAQVSPACGLIIPNNPLSAQGLATPFYLKSLDSALSCHQANASQSVFAQAVVLDMDTGGLFVYNPLVIDYGTTPLVPPVLPPLPQHYTAAIWFSSNSDGLTLLPTDASQQPDSIVQGSCVSGGGIDYTLFGQFAYCNAPTFFNAYYIRFLQQSIVVPPPGLAANSLPCPTIRDFSVVDQDQSDGVTTTYLVTSQGDVLQNTAANRAFANNAGGYTLLTPKGDNYLLNTFIQPALGCESFAVEDLADPGANVPAIGLNELVASLEFPPGVPEARVPLNWNEFFDLHKLNAYRRGVGQWEITRDNAALVSQYCRRLLRAGAPRIWDDRVLTSAAASPDPAASGNLFVYLVRRFLHTVGEEENGGLGCLSRLRQTSPFTVSDEGPNPEITFSPSVKISGSTNTNSNNENDHITIKSHTSSFSSVHSNTNGEEEVSSTEDESDDSVDDSSNAPDVLMPAQSTTAKPASSTSSTTTAGSAGVACGGAIGLMSMYVMARRKKQDEEVKKDNKNEVKVAEQENTNETNEEGAAITTMESTNTST